MSTAKRIRFKPPENQTPYFAHQNILIRRRREAVSHRVPLPTNPLLEPAPAGLRGCFQEVCDCAMDARTDYRPSMCGHMTLEDPRRVFPSGRDPRNHDGIPQAPRDQDGDCRWCGIQIFQEPASRTHLPASRQGQGKGSQGTSVRAVKKRNPMDFCFGVCPHCLAHDKSPHAVTDQIHRFTKGLQSAPQACTEFHKRGAPGIVIPPDCAGADLVFDPAAQPFPTRVTSPNPVEDECRHNAAFLEKGLSEYNLGADPGIGENFQ